MCWPHGHVASSHLAAWCGAQSWMGFAPGDGASGRPDEAEAWWVLCLLWIWGFMETLTAAHWQSPEQEAYFSSCALGSLWHREQTRGSGFLLHTQVQSKIFIWKENENWRCRPSNLFIGSTKMSNVWNDRIMPLDMTSAKEIFSAIVICIMTLGVVQPKH